MNVIQGAIGRFVALRLVKLPRHRKADFRIKWSKGNLLLERTPDTVLSGDRLYSLRFYERRRRLGRFGFGLIDYSKVGHATLGEIVAEDSKWISRRAFNVTGANLQNAIGGWISGWGGTTPQEFGITSPLIYIASSDGSILPCWQDLAGKTSRDWVIHVHGRGATAAETARNYESLRSQGFNNLGLHYRGDGVAQRNGQPDNSTLALGTTEWRDLESALEHLLDGGAEKVFIFGWSYGAAISLQFAAHSMLAERVSGYFFDCPVISWRSTLRHQIAISKAPNFFAILGEKFLNQENGALSIELTRAINFDDFEPINLAKAITKPIVIVHSRDDGFIPIEPSRSLARIRPDLVTLVEFSGARHCKLFNHNASLYLAAMVSLVNC